MPKLEHMVKAMQGNVIKRKSSNSLKLYIDARIKEYAILDTII